MTNPVEPIPTLLCKCMRADCPNPHVSDFPELEPDLDIQLPSLGVPATDRTRINMMTRHRRIE